MIFSSVKVFCINKQAQCIIIDRVFIREYGRVQIERKKWEGWEIEQTHWWLFPMFAKYWLLVVISWYGNAHHSPIHSICPYSCSLAGLRHCHTVGSPFKWILILSGSATSLYCSSGSDFVHCSHIKSVGGIERKKKTILMRQCTMALATEQNRCSGGVTFWHIRVQRDQPLTISCCLRCLSAFSPV